MAAGLPGGNLRFGGLDRYRDSWVAIAGCWPRRRGSALGDNSKFPQKEDEMVHNSRNGTGALKALEGHQDIR